MRTTLAIGDDVLVAARPLAECDRRTVGKVVSALARQGLSHGARSVRTSRNGVCLLPLRKGAAPVTLEIVNRLRDELR